MQIPLKYPKMDTLFERAKEGDNIGKVTNIIRDPRFDIVDPVSWMFTEKIDGTNIRIYSYMDGAARKWAIGGRTDAAQIHGTLMQHVNEMMERIGPILAEKFEGDLVLCGEGCGAGIQKGAGYFDAPHFVMFDIVRTDTAFPVFFEWHSVVGIGQMLDIPVVPQISGDMVDIITMMTEGCTTLLGKQQAQMEGVVARTDPNLYFTTGDSVKPLRWKLKTKDFVKGK